ncbi:MULTISPECIES: hypothetical protein [unclassified Streptomyces]|uniref:DUF7144 family membrane protein n=1 Tax=unclassified Streptomyces TaxID=2593676 RepID=UPI0005A85F95|nr:MULTISPECIES: hypothetical protein [unclassified Streptomyces]ODA74568.1 hypothetical protein APS67_001230 [Streptomyces sp. AVP053U2]
MASTHAHQAQARTRARTSSAKREWAGGLTVFGGVMLMLAGILNIVRGIAGIAEDDVFVATENYVFAFDLTAWGWIHLALGALAVLISVGLFQAGTWARVAGVAIGGLVMIANFVSLPYAPVWSVVMIALSGAMIWALCTVRPGDT